MRAFQISALIETAVRDERERIIAMNAPEIERINAYIKALEDAAQQALEALERYQVKRQDFDRFADEITALRAALAEPDVPETDFGNMAVAVAEPVASVTECEACFTPDVCQLRGTCDHYAAERLRVAAPPQREPVGSEWEPCVKLPVTVHVRAQRTGETHVSTREGITPVKPDDLIMRGVSGEEYPIGRDIFERTYQRGEAPSQRKPLTDEDIEAIRINEEFDLWGIREGAFKYCARSIEHAHGIKENP